MYDPRNVPDYFKDSINLYVLSGLPTGHFLRAVLANDLMSAVSSADPTARERLSDIACYVYNDVPMAASGSVAQVDGWLAAHRLAREAGEPIPDDLPEEEDLPAERHRVAAIIARYLRQVEVTMTVATP